MPRYEYWCAEGHCTEAVRGYDVTVVPCQACAAVAQRAGFCRDVQIIGDTVAVGRPRAKQEALDKYGRYRLGAMRDAHQELYEDHRREGLPMPDYQRIGRERAKRIRAVAASER